MSNFGLTELVNRLDHRGLLSRFGGIGNVYYVIGSAESYLTNAKKVLSRTYPDGTQSVHATLASAYAATTSGRNDIIVLDGNTTHTVTAMIDFAKNRVHVVGIDFLLGLHRKTSSSSKIQLGVTTVATDLAPIISTGVRNSFIGVKVINANTKNESLYGFIDNGEATYFEDFHSLKVAGLDDAGHAHFWMASDSSSGKNMTLGQSNIPSSAAGYGILIDGKSGGGAGGVVKENYFENVRVNMSVANGVVATSCFIKIADTAAMNFVNAIDRLRCYNYNPVGAAVMTDAILGVDNTVSGRLFLADSVFFGCTGVGAGATQGVYTASSGVAPVANGGLSTAVTD